MYVFIEAFKWALSFGIEVNRFIGQLWRPHVASIIRAIQLIGLIMV